MEKLPSSDKSHESPHDSFEVVELPSLSPADVGNDDRAFIYTESGNRYMVRHSKSRGGALVIYNEREGGFFAENAHPFRARSNTLASVGQSFEYFAITDEASQEGNMATSTKITRIEVRRGLDKAAENGTITGESIADMLIDTAKGKRRP
jgi:hypothetical protein